MPKKKIIALIIAILGAIITVLQSGCAVDFKGEKIEWRSSEKQIPINKATQLPIKYQNKNTLEYFCSIPLKQETCKSDSLGMKTISERVSEYQSYANDYYRKPSGRPTTEAKSIEYTLRHLVSLFGDLEPNNFKPSHLRKLQSHFEDQGWTRQTVNQRIDKVRRFFSWCVEYEYANAMTHYALKNVKQLKKGRCNAPENRDVKAPAWGNIQKVIAKLHHENQAMVRIQMLTGMRSSELCNMQAEDIEVKSDVWIYRPKEHKGDLYNSKEIVLGKRCQSIIGRRYSQGGYIFRTRNHTPYTDNTYRQNVMRGCRRAGVDHIFPHQFRHWAATHIFDEYGLSEASELLGHAGEAITLNYTKSSEKPLKTKIDLAKKAS